MSIPEDLHKPLDLKIIRTLLSALPEGWFGMEMEVQAHADDPFSVSITDGQNECLPTTPPDELYATLLEHQQLFASHGRPWKSLKYRLTFDESEENWVFSIDYGY